MDLNSGVPTIVSALKLPIVPKWFLRVAAKTPNIMVYGDAGRYPLDRINAQIRSGKSRLRVLRMEQDRYSHQVYMSMLNKIECRVNWATGIKMLLIEYDFEMEWPFQAVQNETLFLKLLRGRVIDGYINDWKSRVQTSVRYSFYRLVNVDLFAEPYLYTLHKRVFRDSVKHFRMGISDLFVRKHR